MTEVVNQSGIVLQDLSLFINKEDLPYEEDVHRNQYSVRSWLRYIDHKQSNLLLNDNSKSKIPNLRPLFILYERALKELPGSYKLWKKYLDFRKQFIRRHYKTFEDVDQYNKMNNCYERALFLLNKMPRIWLDYAGFLMVQAKVTQTRRVFDRALRSLPVTQHTRIWPIYLKFAKKIGGETALTIYKRFIKFDIEKIEDFVDILIGLEKYDEAAFQLSRMLDLEIPSKRNKTPYQIWMDLADLICQHPKDIKRLKVEPILRSGILRFTDQVGRLWCSLAQYWILLGRMDLARDVFEEGIGSVTTVRDFTQIFDSFTEFEDAWTTSIAENIPQNNYEEAQLELQLLRFENLINRRPFLINEVLLRQNPHNVAEWIKKIELYREDTQKAVEVFDEAIKTIQPKRATANLLPKLWIHFSKFYEEAGNLDNARAIFDRAALEPFKTVDELAEIWREYAEFEIRNDDYQRALNVLSRATRPPAKFKGVDFYDDTIPVQNRVFKSLKLWTFYVDLEESVGDLESTRAIYDKIMELKIANPQIIINYASFLEENKYFEESFKIYERGLELFNYPIAFEIWNIYLTKFIKRYGGTKLERARDLFEQAIEHCPSKYAKPIFLLYGKLEEDYGLAKHAMRIYDRATRKVSNQDRYEMFQFYIAKAKTTFGITSCREIYERAIETLPDLQCKDICLDYAALERQLGEIDRARAIYAHGSQFADPTAASKFWKVWYDFEVEHGNEDTFKEMLRIKRSVQAQMNTEIHHLSAQIQAKNDSVTSTGMTGFVKGSNQIYVKNVDQELDSQMAQTENPDEIEL